LPWRTAGDRGTSRSAALLVDDASGDAAGRRRTSATSLAPGWIPSARARHQVFFFFDDLSSGRASARGPPSSGAGVRGALVRGRRLDLERERPLAEARDREPALRVGRSPSRGAPRGVEGAHAEELRAVEAEA
jgi:hypothetical protein